MFSKEKLIMKKQIIFGVLIATFLMLITPTINAQQYMQVKEEIQLKIEENINDYYQEIGIELNDNDVKPTFIQFIMNLIISLIFTIFGTLTGIIFGPMIAFILRLITAPAVILAKIVSFLVNGFSFSQA